jgi:hypothetical protein
MRRFGPEMVRHILKRKIFATILIALILGPVFGFFSNWTQAPAAVGMVCLEGFSQGAFNKIRWQTGSESEITFFKLFKRTQEQTDWMEINSQTAIDPGGPTGHDYSYDDNTINSGTTYLYKLTVFYNRQPPTEDEGPITVVAGTAVTIPAIVCSSSPASTPKSPTATNNHTPTLTSTTTHTPTVTRTATLGPSPTNTSVGSSSATPTRTNTPVTQSSQSQYPGPATVTPVRSSGPLPTSVQATPSPGVPLDEGGDPYPFQSNPITNPITSPITSSVGSLINPFPSVTVQFPDLIPTEPLQSASRTGMVKASESGGLELNRVIPIFVVGIIWMLLGVWFVFAWRRYR